MNPTDEFDHRAWRPPPIIWTSLAPTVPREPLEPDSRLVVSKYARIQTEGDRVVLIDMGSRLVTVDLDNGERLAALLACLDGHRSIADVARAWGNSLDVTLQSIQELYLLAVLLQVGDAPVPALTFAKHLDNHVQVLSARMSEELPSVLSVLERTRSPSLLFGWLLETYHFVASAASHISPAIARAPNYNLQMMLSEYLASEYWHGRRLREGLLAAGLSEAAIERTDPLPGTLAIINNLRCAAATDILSYSACLAVGELDKNASEATTGFFAQLEALNLLPLEAIEPFKLHALQDCSADHHSYAEEAFAVCSPLTRPQQDSIRRTVLMYLHSAGEQLLQIQRYYSGGPSLRTFSVD